MIFLSEEDLIRQYSRIVKILSRKFFLLGGDNEDLYQEGMIALLHAIRNYDSNNQTSFEHYAKTCIRNKMIDTIRSKVYSGFDQVPEDFDKIINGPEEYMLDNEAYIELISDCKKLLSKYEFTVLELYLQGYDYSEIANINNKTTTSVYNAIQRLRQKLKVLSD